MYSDHFRVNQLRSLIALGGGEVSRIVKYRPESEKLQTNIFTTTVSDAFGEMTADDSGAIEKPLSRHW